MNHQWQRSLRVCRWDMMTQRILTPLICHPGKTAVPKIKKKNIFFFLNCCCKKRKKLFEKITFSLLSIFHFLSPPLPQFTSQKRVKKFCNIHLFDVTDYITFSCLLFFFLFYFCYIYLNYDYYVCLTGLYTFRFFFFVKFFGLFYLFIQSFFFFFICCCCCCCFQCWFIDGRNRQKNWET